MQRVAARGGLAVREEGVWVLLLAGPHMLNPSGRSMVHEAQTLG